MQRVAAGGGPPTAVPLAGNTAGAISFTVTYHKN